MGYKRFEQRRIVLLLLGYCSRVSLISRYELNTIEKTRLFPREMICHTFINTELQMKEIK